MADWSFKFLIPQSQEKKNVNMKTWVSLHWKGTER